MHLKTEIKASVKIETMIDEFKDGLMEYKVFSLLKI